MQRSYYMSSIKNFINLEDDAILGELLINDEFETTDLQKNSWKKEIEILKDQLKNYQDGDIAFEYTIPRLGHRIDVVCIIDGIIFLLEFKSGEKEYKKATDDQVMDYALDLKYFHEKSRERYIIPVSISTEAPSQIIFIEFPAGDKVASVIRCNKNNIVNCIQTVLSKYKDSPLPISEWSASRYSPTPTIIEAAQALYRNHSVDEISRNDAGAKNLEVTSEAISKIINSCKREHKKAICFITGVPGAGKTLAGLNIANERHQFDEDEHAVFLSGNEPLVDVLQEALARDKKERDHVSIAEARRQTKAFIQIIHKFRDESLTTDEPPIEKVVIFDEAQRAWDKNELSKFMKNKKGIPDFNQSEPEFLISIMNRHKDWAVIVCLVGGGQEIYSGEAGIENWFQILNEKYNNWDIYLSDQITDSEYVGNSSINNLLKNRHFNVNSNLHLKVSLRSFRSEKLAAFVKALLDNDTIRASEIYLELNDKYPIVMTRDFDKAKSWVKSKSRGNERYGLLACSTGKRLRALGIWVPAVIDHVKWFLGGKDNVNSSYYLEVAASEFKVQGLEIDYGLIAWDADFRYIQGKFDYYNYHGTRWNHINIEQNQNYLKNAYRVLLTRSRQGMVIFIPEGSEEDESRHIEYYDGTYKYLKEIGITEI